MNNLKSRISDFLNSEDGRVGVKAPLALGVAAGGLILAHFSKFHRGVYYE